MRHRLPLNGTWCYQVDARNVGDEQEWMRTDCDRSGWPEITVPVLGFDVDAPPNPLKGYEGTAWWSRTVVIPDAFRGQSVDLRFEGSNYETKAWVNGHYLGSHEGAFLGFGFTIPSDVIRYNQPNVIVVRTNNESLTSRAPGPVYGWWNHGGPYRDVFLETRPPLHIADVTVKTSLEDGAAALLAVDIVVENDTRQETTSLDIRVHLQDDRGNVIVGKIRDVSAISTGGSSAAAMRLRLANPRLWSPDDPYLYTLSLEIAQENQVLDALEIPVGVREIRVEGPKILLNGTEILIKGVNRHEDYATTGRSHDPDWLRHDLRLLKEMGVNMIRTSHYPNHPAFYRLCDRMGFLVMDEIPLYWWGVEKPRGYDDPRALDAAESQVREMVRRDKNHPSVVFWSVSNETRGGDPAVDEGNRRLMAAAREEDDTRLVVHVSDHWENDPALDAVDVICINEYFGFHHKMRLDTISELPAFEPPLVEALSKLAAKHPDKPIVVSEFGCVGIYGLHGEHFGTEDYQVAFVQKHFRVLTGQPQVRGVVYWAYADYPGHRRANFSSEFAVGYYGFVTRTRKQKQMCEALRQLYAGWNLE